MVFQVITACGHKVGWLIAKKSWDRKVPGFFARAMSCIPVVRPQVTNSSGFSCIGQARCLVYTAVPMVLVVGLSQLAMKSAVGQTCLLGIRANEPRYIVVLPYAPVANAANLFAAGQRCVPLYTTDVVVIFCVLLLV